MNFPYKYHVYFNSIYDSTTKSNTIITGSSADSFTLIVLLQ